MQKNRLHRDSKPVIGITLGDYNGIGPEVVLKALADNRILNMCTPVMYGSMKILSRYRRLYQLPDWFINQVTNIEQITFKKTNLVGVLPQMNHNIQPGQPDEAAGKYAFECLKRATEDLRNGGLDAVVTAPINKFTIQNEDFKFPGHTEYFTEAFQAKDSLMFLVSPTLRVGVVTGHVPLQEVSNNLTREKIHTKIQQMVNSLQLDFGINKPKIAVLGLNPHAGEEGLLGDEEINIIRPAILELKKKGLIIFGPYPADGFFGHGEYKKYDAVLAMYHDQGLVPFKTIAFENGVNFTAGLPIIRTSPDHGTAFNIAGKNQADETSMREAIFTAIDIVKQRRIIDNEEEQKETK
ncbi:MAG: 4-hydroxythreonine-4-phosphate dehydrogenase PdxA [Bacteroidetes bacterium]|nr:MAG: 4-hydroxythreonine-4-phosphate dehydrogenase PdxA [Bacteroidota bacterium]